MKKMKRKRSRRSLKRKLRKNIRLTSSDKLEDVKIVSTAFAAILSGITIICAAVDIDGVVNGTYRMWGLTLGSAIITAICYIVAFVSSSILKERQREEYWTIKMYFEAFIEVFYPSLCADYSLQLKKNNVSERDKQTKLWKKLCTGYDKHRIFLLFLWLALVGACVWVVIHKIQYDAPDKIEFTTMFSIIILCLLVVVFFVGTSIKKDPMPLFEYMDTNKIKFHTLAEHYENSKRISFRIWTDMEYVFMLAKGKADCFAMDEYDEMSIMLNRVWFTMILTSKYDCIVQSSILPIGFYKLKRILENNKEVQKSEVKEAANGKNED